jgi:hypothetical protein
MHTRVDARADEAEYKSIFFPYADALSCDDAVFAVRRSAAVGAPTPVTPTILNQNGVCLMWTLIGSNQCPYMVMLMPFPTATSSLNGLFAESRLWSRTLQPVEVAGVYSQPPPNVTPVKFATFGLATTINFGTRPYLTPRVTSPDATSLLFVTLSPPANVPIDMSLWLYSAANPASMLTFTVSAGAFPASSQSALTAPNLVITFDQSGDVTNFLPVAPLQLGPASLTSLASWSLQVSAPSVHAQWAPATTSAAGGVAVLAWQSVH